ncbi:MAG: DUF6288 domain-containing protein [Candidatus Sumerlaeota bacterium]|nr:DUF6288 domain-containing protein [Candidatus Sumerlaeota bacterium]
MTMKSFSLCLAGCALALLLSGYALAAKPPVPDLTKDGQKDRMHDWTLGPTGARGWIWGWNTETTDARQILITKIEKGSPADGALDVGDVILGVNGKPFDGDARKAFGRAITEAETAENKGFLKLIRWRKGVQTPVSLQLKVMGSYSDTAPYNCPKSKLILEQACRYLSTQKLGADIVGKITALAMLASGKPEFADKVKSLAHKLGPANLKLELRPGMYAWDWAYSNILLCEYYQATKDDSVLPAIREYSRTIGMGQSAVGTWGHGMSLPSDEGRLGGYGAINQPGLGCWLSMVMGQKCGVNDPEVKRAVEKSRRFFRYYVNKGSIPYGDHPPFWDLHDNNGKNAFTAVAFDLLGDREATKFFARMATAAYEEKEYGHTGNYFSYLWGPLGVNRAGAKAVAAYLKEQRWYYDLARRWDGGFTYQGGAGADDSYAGWDMTGVFVLAYALPLAKLNITGKGIDKANEIAGAELQQTMADGREFSNWHHKDCYDGDSETELLKRLSSWSPVVRYRAAESLSRKKGDFIPQLIKMLVSDNLDTRYGSCQALEYQREKAAPATDELIKLLAHNDQWLRIRASYALAGIGKAARKAAPDMLKLSLVEDKNDPREMMRRYLCLCLFLSGYADNAPRRGLLADSIDGIDRQLLIPAIKRMLTAEDGLSRSQLASVYPKLNDAELDLLWPDILRATEKSAPSGEMFSDGIRLAGLELLAKHHIKEGMRVCLIYGRTQNPWDSQDRMWEIMKALKSYGAAAKELLPELRSLAAYCKTEPNFPDDCKKKKTAAVEDAIKAIEAATTQPQLRSIALLILKEQKSN